MTKGKEEKNHDIIERKTSQSEQRTNQNRPTQLLGKRKKKEKKKKKKKTNKNEKKFSHQTQKKLND